MVVAALLVGVGWSLASPPGSAPDDNWHMPSIWCAPGASSDVCGAVEGRSDLRLLPAEVASSTCFVQDPTKSGACQYDQDGVLTLDTEVSTGNWLHSYPPVFYMFMHLFITDHLYSSVVLMRLANVVLTVLSVALLVLLVPSRLRSVATLPIALTTIPLGLSLLASTNPSAWAYVSAATLWVSLYASFEVLGRRRWSLWAYALVMTVIGAGSRADSALFCVMAVGLVLLLRLPRLISDKRGLIVPLACAVVGGAFFLTSGQSNAVSTGFGGTPARTTSVIELTIANIQQLPVLWFGSLGFGFMGSIGWLDTVFPPVLFFLTVAAWAGVVFAALRVQSKLKIAALVALSVAITVYPLYLLAKSRLPVGQGFQPRYVLPILVILTGVCLLPVAGDRLRLTKLQAYVAAAALSIAQFVALYTQIRRYVTGNDKSGFDLDRGREWWWDWPVSATAVWIVASAAFAVLGIGLFRMLTVDPRETASPSSSIGDRHPAQAVDEHTDAPVEPRGTPRRLPQPTSS